MLNFFRRIRQSLLGSGQTRKYILYAIGEIALVVIGILLALQINNWNEFRKERQVEQELLEGLRSEMTYNREHLDYIIRSHQRSLKGNLALMKLFGTAWTHYSDRHLDSIFVSMMQGSTYDPYYGLLKSAISSGKINFIRNQHLVTLLSQFENQVEDTKEEVSTCNDLVENQIRPLIRRHIPLNSKLTIEKNPAWGIMPVSPFQPNYEAFYNDQELESAIATYVAWLHLAINEEEELISSIDEMIVLIDEESRSSNRARYMQEIKTQSTKLPY